MFCVYLWAPEHVLLFCSLSYHFFFFIYLLFTHASFWWTIRNRQTVVYIRWFPLRMNNGRILDSISILYTSYYVIILLFHSSRGLDKQFDLLRQYTSYIGILGYTHNTIHGFIETLTF